MDIVSVKIEPKHFKAATGYISNKSCPLAIALRDMFFTTNVEVYENFVQINGVKAYFDHHFWGGILGYTPSQIDKFCKDAKVSLAGIPEVTLILKKTMETIEDH
jgi:hypothetical protein